jgi:hypothetical protein
MKKKTLLFTIIIAITLSNAAYANWYQDIINAIVQQGTIGNGFLDSINSQQGAMLSSQQDIQKLMKQVNGSLNGNSGWGSYNTHDYQSYGDSARSWSDVMKLTEGGSSGALGQTMHSIAGQFPIDKDSFNKGVTDSNSRQYYAVQSQTVLATRAASQLDYDKVQDQISYQQMLQQQIEKAKDLKSAVDLNNRIQVEANLINLEILRQSALANQQHAISEQANMNSALSNAKFLTKQ